MKENPLKTSLINKKFAQIPLLKLPESSNLEQTEMTMIYSERATKERKEMSKVSRSVILFEENSLTQQSLTER